MEIIRHYAHARAGLLGNPSDGYHGKTLSFIIRDFQAEAVLYDWDEVEIVVTRDDRSRFRSVRELVGDVRLHGYYGGIRLVKATIKKFVEYCARKSESDAAFRLHDRNFSIRYATDIPRQVGMAGSSAIVVATLRALMDFYGVTIPKQVQPSFVLAVESEELGITAGLQDRVIQVYGGLVYMDFSYDKMTLRDGMWCGTYEPIDPALLPPIYVAYSTDVGEPTEVFHNNLRARYEQGDPDVIGAMEKFADIARRGRDVLLERHPEKLGALIDENFDTRRSICQLPREHIAMVEAARSVGASAKFAGSGGAIVGTYEDAAMWERLREKLEALNCRLFKPTLGPE